MCVRWDQNGKRLASVSWDRTVKVLDFASEKVTYTGEIVDQSESLLFILWKKLIKNFYRNCLLDMFSLKKAV